MPTFSKLARNAVVLAAAGFELGATVYLIHDLLTSGEGSDIHTLSSGVATICLGSGLLYYMCQEFVWNDVDSDPPEDTKPQANLFFGKGAENNPACVYITGNTKPHELVERLFIETTSINGLDLVPSTEMCTFLTIVTKAMAARKVVDIGVFTGLSTLALGLGITNDGQVVSCSSKDSKEIQLSKGYWKEAGLESKIKLNHESVSDTLQRLIDAGESESFDVACISAYTKSPSYYYRLCFHLLRSRGLIIVSDTFCNGKVIDGDENNEFVVGIHKLNEEVKKDHRVQSAQLNLGGGTAIIQKL